MNSKLSASSRGFRSRVRFVELNDTQINSIISKIIEQYHKNYPTFSRIVNFSVNGGTIKIEFEQPVKKDSIENFKKLRDAAANTINYYQPSQSKNKNLFRNNFCILDNDLTSDNHLDDTKNKVEFKILSKISYDKIEQGLNHHLDMLNLSFSGGVLTTHSSAYYITKETKEKQESFRLGVKSAVLINDYHTKKHPECKNVFICDSSESFVNTLKHFNTLSLPDNLNIGLELVLPEGHMMPIKLERRNGKNYFTIIDSVADSKYLKYAIDAIHDNMPDASIKYTKDSRQCDSFSCPVFTVRDMKKMMCTEDLYKGLTDTGNDYIYDSTEENILAYGCNTPANFMDMTQSSSNLERYYESNDNDIENKKLFDKVKTEKYSQEDGKLLSPLYMENDKLKNYRCRYFAHKYQKIVKDDYLTSASKVNTVLHNRSANAITQNFFNSLKKEQMNHSNDYQGESLKRINNLIKIFS